MPWGRWLHFGKVPRLNQACTDHVPLVIPTHFSTKTLKSWMVGQTQHRDSGRLGSVSPTLEIKPVVNTTLVQPSPPRKYQVKHSHPPGLRV